MVAGARKGFSTPVQLVWGWFAPPPPPPPSLSTPPHCARSSFHPGQIAALTTHATPPRPCRSHAAGPTPLAFVAPGVSTTAATYAAAADAGVVPCADASDRFVRCTPPSGSQASLATILPVILLLYGCAFVDSNQHSQMPLVAKHVCDHYHYHSSRASTVS
jgi:hypothetical protein